MIKVFRILDVSVLVVNGLLAVAGKQDGTGYKLIKVGSILTDGENRYEITGIPFVHYNTVKDMKENICVTIKDDGFAHGTLEGKTLELVS